MVAYDTYYDLLDVDTDATTDDIKHAYRQKVKRYHPDVSDDPNADDIFKALTDAKETLTDEQERARYDRLGHTQYINNTTTADPQTSQPTQQNQSQPHRNQTHATETTQHSSHTHRREPEADDWVGEPGWSDQPGDNTTQNRPPGHDDIYSEDNPDTSVEPNKATHVIPPDYFTEAITGTILLYGFSMYGIFAPATSPVHTILSVFCLPVLFILLSTSRVGFYTFGTFTILTPPILLATALQPASTAFILPSLLAPFGILLTLLVISIRPS